MRPGDYDRNGPGGTRPGRDARRASNRRWWLLLVVTAWAGLLTVEPGGWVGLLAVVVTALYGVWAVATDPPRDDRRRW